LIRVPRIVGDRIAVPQVHPGAAGEGQPEQAFRLGQVSEIHGVKAIRPLSQRGSSRITPVAPD
jgi:hypothetical protein